MDAPAGYSDKVVEHFLHPKHLGVLSAADVHPPGEQLIVGDAGHVTRGDALRLTLKLSAADNRILDARFQNFGTGLPIAGASCFCSLIIGKTLDEALRVTAEDLDRELDGLPELKRRQPVLVLDALDVAVRKLRGEPQREKGLPGEPPLCTCFQVRESTIERTIRLRGVKSLDALIAATRAGAGCHTCHPDLEQILARCARGEYKFHIPYEDYHAAHKLYGAPLPSTEELSKNPPPPAAPKPPARTAAVAPDGFVYPDVSPAELAARKSAVKREARRPWKELSEKERLERLEEVIESDLRPAIRSDGGDIKLVGLKENRVLVSLSGHCQNCHSALSTLKLGVEKRLQDVVWPELEVEEVF